MTKKLVNSTGRKEIPRSAVSIVLLDDAGTKAKVELDFSKLKFPKDWLVVVEAHRGTSLLRFDCGTVGRLFVPAIDLGALDPREGRIIFRIKAIEKGMVRGLSPEIHPQGLGEEKGKESLLPISYVDLGQRISKVSGDSETPPCLLLNKKISGIEATWKSDPMFKGTIVVAAFETILRRLADSYIEEDDPEHWRSRWHRYCTQMLGGDELSTEMDADDKEAWVDTMVNAFANHAAFVDAITARAKGTMDD